MKTWQPRISHFLLIVGFVQAVSGCEKSSVDSGQAQKPVYTADYVKANADKAQFSIPEVLELSQIALSLTTYRDKTRTGKYWTDVQSQFGPYRTHPLITKLTTMVTGVSDDYDLRAGAFATEFDKNGNLVDGFYPYAGGKNILGQLKKDFIDFSRKSNFRTFYQNQQPFYEELKSTQAQLMPVRRMWNWLEERFPARSQSYKIIFSPLIGGNHNTVWYGNAAFRESLMFVSYTGNCCQAYSQPVKEGISSRVVFTEIDHNYVNPVSDEYKALIDKSFQNRAKWVGAKDADNYPTAILVFNEYMTWAVFTLYCFDNYEKDNFATINQLTENQMVNSRGFVKFRDFNQHLLTLYQRDRTMTSKDFFVKVLDWANNQ